MDTIKKAVLVKKVTDLIIDHEHQNDCYVPCAVTLADMIVEEIAADLVKPTNEK